MGSDAGEGVWRLDSNARSIRQLRVMIVLKQASDGAGAAAVRRSKPNALKGRSESDGSIGEGCNAAADTVSQKRRSDGFQWIDLICLNENRTMRFTCQKGN